MSESGHAMTPTDERAGLDALLATAPVGLGLLDRDLRYVSLNRALADLAGVPPDAHIGRRVEEVLPDIPEAPILLRQVLASGEPIVDWEVDGRTRAAPGVRRWRVSAYPVQGGVGLILTEVPPALAGARAQEERERHFRALAEHAPVGIFQTDARGRCRYVNGRWCEQAGLPAERAAGDGWTQSVHPEDRGHVTSEWRAAVREGRAFGPVDHRFVRPDGESAWVVVRAVPIPGEDDAPAGWLGTVTDVTDRRRASERTARLQDVSSALAGSLTVEDVAQAVTERGVGLAGAAAGAVALLSEDGREFVTRGIAGYAPDVAPDFATYPVDAPLPLPDAAREGPIWLGSSAAVVERYPHLRRYHQGAQHEAVAVLPLVVDGRAIGGLALSFHEPQQFDRDDREFLLALGDLCAGALERARRHETERRDRERQEFMAEASRLLASSLEPAVTLADVARLAVPRLADWCTIALREQDDLRTVAVRHVDPDLTARGEELWRRWPPRLDEESGLGRVSRTGVAELHVQVTDDVIAGSGADPERVTFLRELGLRSVMTVPLNARGRTLGALSLAVGISNRRYGPSDLALAEDLGRRAALARDNARLYARAKAAGLAAEEARALLDTTLESAPTGFALFDRDLRFLRVNAALARINGAAAEDHVGRTLAEVVPDLPDEGALDPLREVLEAGRPIVDREVTGRTAADPWRTHTWLVSYYPVRGPEGEIAALGAFVVDITDRKEAEARLAFLAEAGGALDSDLAIGERLDRLARLCAPGLADLCTIELADQVGELTGVAASAAEPDLEPVAALLRGSHRSRVNRPASALDVAIAAGRAILVREPGEEALATLAPDEAAAEAIRALAPRAWLVAPLVARGRIVGRIGLIATRSGQPFREGDRAVAEELGRRAGIAVDNFRLYERQRSIARTLQRSLLPPALPTVPGLDVAARYVAAGAGHEVGGDFYDLFELDGGGWAAVLGAVCGKGPEAAALTALARHTIRAESDRLAPSAVLAALNRAVIRHQTGMRFLTACYVWLRPEASGAEVTVGRGGHTPALILRRGGEVERVQPPGPLVGIYSDAVFGDVDVRLAPGDAVVLYSDGITEARGADGSLYGPERLVGALTSGPRDSAEEVAESVARSVSAFEPVPSDDVALLVLRLAD